MRVRLKSRVKVEEEYTMGERGWGLGSGFRMHGREWWS